MRDVTTTPMFAPAAPILGNHATAIKESDRVHITGPASLEGVLAIGQLEAACLDIGVKYRRRFFTPRHHLPRDAPAAWSVEGTGLTVIVDVEEATWQIEDLPNNEHVHIVPLQTSVELGSKSRRFGGALDAVVQAGAVAALLAPNGRRVRKLRPYISLGLWLRAALDTNMDPIHSMVVNHLGEEGTLRLVPLPEVSQPAAGMIPGLSERQLARLRKVWPTMDVDQRSMALSELLLPCLSEEELSTPRLEELAWHRMLVGDAEVDLASQVHTIRQGWPEKQEEGRLFASTLLDRWLRTGHLSGSD